MKLLLAFYICLFNLLSQFSFAQKIVYSEPDKNDTRRMKFEVIGKVAGNFLIYKNVRAQNLIAVYDNDMKEINLEEHDYVPNDKLINVDFFAYYDFAYMIYEYQKKNVVYCKAVKLDGMGKKISEVMTLDTSHISFFANNNKIYSTVASEDKNSIMLFKINSKNKSNYLITTLLFNNKLDLQKRSSMWLPMDERNDYVDAFDVDNDGDFVFIKYNRLNSENIKSASMMWKPVQSDSLIAISMPINDLLLDEIHLKIDNPNKRYFATSFYTKKRRDNIEGIYFYVWDKQSRQPSMQNAVALGEELRKEAKGEAGIKGAFNNYFIKDIIIKKDGGFIIGSEAYYTTSRYNNWNRWDYLYGSPYYNSYDYYSYSPFYNSWRYRTNNQSVRYHADNITILSFDNTGKMQWNGVIHKEQFDDETDDRISYMTLNTGGQLHYLFNMDEKRALLLNDYTLTPQGEINRNPTLKNLDRGFEFMPKYGKQVSSKQAIIPCYYRNYICFAKIDFNF
ncbi:MAG: hypothetical protein C4329_02285 [Chitinophagaceae bacterium]